MFSRFGKFIHLRFFRLFNHIQKGSAIPRGCSYYLFREGIPPLLEDAQNFRGGTWTYKSDHWRRREEMDNLLLYLVSYNFLSALLFKNFYFSFIEKWRRCWWWSERQVERPRTNAMVWRFKSGAGLTSWFCGLATVLRMTRSGPLGEALLQVGWQGTIRKS